MKITAPEAGEIKACRDKDWGQSVPVDLTLDEVKIGDYDALILTQLPDEPRTPRISDKALAIIKAFLDGGKVVAAICHGAWLLIETGAVKGREVRSYISIRTDVANAGGRWVDRQVVGRRRHRHRAPGDLEAFVAKIVEEESERARPRPDSRSPAGLTAATFVR